MHYTKNQIKRFPLYLNYLHSLKDEGLFYISSIQAAIYLKINNEVVKKDFYSLLSEKGKPNTGRDIDQLIERIDEALGHHHEMKAVIVGVGSLGKALINFTAFNRNGFEIMMAFDVNRMLYEIDVNGVLVKPLEELEEYVKNNDIEVGIITTPASQAQHVADIMIRAGIKGIWNFAPIRIKNETNIPIECTNISVDFSSLAQRIKKGEKENGRKELKSRNDL